MNKVKLTIVGVLAMMLASCSSFLDINPHSAVAPEQITEADLEALRTGMYWRVQESPKRESYILFDILGGTLASSTGNPIDLIKSTLNPLNSVVANNWSGLYKALYQVNNVIKSLENVKEGTLKNKVAGETHFFRAYIYHNLVTRWGDVPILRENTMDKVARDPEAEVWQFIESELTLAEQLLADAPSYYYVSIDAVRALQARVYLHRGKMADAALIAEDLISNSKYALAAFEDIFRKETNREIIFAFECLQEDGTGITLSTMFYTYGHPNKGSYIYRPPYDVMNMYELGDKRKAISITKVDGDDCVNKYPSGQTGTDPFIVSRLAEMYLISAEAQGLSGLNRLNELRRFRGLGDLSPAPTTDEAYIDAILLERRRELLCEGFSYYDMVRTGRSEELGLLEHQKRLPIPGKELTLNPNLEPNPGY